MDTIEKVRGQDDLAEHQNNYEVIRNKNIEEEHQMRSTLEEKVVVLKVRATSRMLTSLPFRIVAMLN